MMVRVGDLSKGVLLTAAIAAITAAVARLESEVTVSIALFGIGIALIMLYSHLVEAQTSEKLYKRLKGG